MRLDPDEMERWVTDDVVRIMDSWSAHNRGLPLSAEARYFLAEHHKRLRAAPAVGDLIASACRERGAHNG